jgi:hypothetical protein
MTTENGQSSAPSASRCYATVSEYDAHEIVMQVTELPDPPHDLVMVARRIRKKLPWFYLSNSPGGEGWKNCYVCNGLHVPSYDKDECQKCGHSNNWKVGCGW